MITKFVDMFERMARDRRMQLGRRLEIVDGTRVHQDQADAFLEETMNFLLWVFVFRVSFFSTRS